MKRMKKLVTVILGVALIFLSYGVLNGYGFMEDKDIPTIEQLTHGKLKVGDTFGKEDLPILKDYLAPGIQAMVERGMKGVIGPQIPFEKQFPPSFLVATKKAQGKSYIDATRACWMKTPTNEKAYFTGGLPFWPNPQTGIEAMENLRFGRYMVDEYHALVRMDLVDAKGAAYKKLYSHYEIVYVNPRVKLPPFPAIYSKENYRNRVYYYFPYDIDGLCLIKTRFYDDMAAPDQGYIYVPALKRTLRVATTTWADNMAGTDMTWGDSDTGLGEPFKYWDYTIVAKDKIMLCPSIGNPLSSYKNGEIIPNVPIDEGQKFARVLWNVRPVWIVEAIPNISHVYGKKIFYLDGQAFRCHTFENYDHQGKLWKNWIQCTGQQADKDGENYSVGSYPSMYDIQKDSMTRLTSYYVGINDASVTPESYTLKKLMELGK